jgi:PAS domain S-box-containing protein
MLHKLLASATWGDITLFFTGIMLIIEFISATFDKKFLGTWLFTKIKNFCLFPIKVYKKLESIESNQKIFSDEIKKIKSEVQFNGGKYKLRDAVEDIKDLTELISYNQAIISEKQRSMMYIDSNPIYIADKEGNWNFVNASLLEMLGYHDPKDIYGIGWMKAIPDEDIDKVEKEYIRDKSNQSPSFGQMRFKDGKGNLVLVNRRTTLIYVNNKLEEIMGTLTIIK